MNVKICGIMEPDAAICAIENGADAIGFVFAPSRRQVTPEQAKEIVSKLPKSILKVGVFVNEAIATVNQIVKSVGLDLVQLHGDESPEYCDELIIPVIKAFSIETEEDLKGIEQYPCEFVLLDSPKGKYRGGNGTVFDWKLLKGFNPKEKAIILAGGLKEENVRAAILATKPFMIDVSSGVETNGKKDLQKIKRFLRVAKCTKGEEINI